MAERARLIDEVRKYRTLWDPGHEDYSSGAARDACWFQISQTLGSNSEALKREWKTLRDSLRQALRRRPRRPGEPPRRWRYERQMSFLFPYLTERVLVTFCSDLLEDSRQPRNLTSSDSSYKPGGKKRPVDVDPVAEGEDDEETPRAARAAPVSPGAPPPDSQEPEALELFFASVCQSTRRLPLRYQHQIQRHVLELVLRAEEDYEAEAAAGGEHALLFDDPPCAQRRQKLRAAVMCGRRAAGGPKGASDTEQTPDGRPKRNKSSLQINIYICKKGIPFKQKPITRLRKKQTKKQCIEFKCAHAHHAKHETAALNCLRMMPCAGLTLFNPSFFSPAYPILRHCDGFVRYTLQYDSTTAARRWRSECGLLSEVVNVDDERLFLIEHSYVRWKMTKIRIGVHEIKNERERYATSSSRSILAEAASQTRGQPPVRREHKQLTRLTPRARRKRQPPAHPPLPPHRRFIHEHLLIMICV
ncbi:hypothetical protein EVAR_86952_1 [Eumeta japonica]|uniref:MADF domain-containing protein n=1 Tax=Eumeta variegata TaxID=151549 RepID=A0A4C1W876_EUMVA|nr:hypothetical protein EVAR_86952_1 [Eumeta japonica]